MLDRVERIDGGLNAYLHVDADSVLEQATAAAGRAEAPLRGIPPLLRVGAALGA